MGAFQVFSNKEMFWKLSEGVICPRPDAQTGSSPPLIIQARAARLDLLSALRKRERMWRGGGVVERGGGEQQRD